MKKGKGKEEEWRGEEEGIRGGEGGGIVLCRTRAKQCRVFESCLGQQDRLCGTAKSGKGSDLKMPCQNDVDTFSSSP